MAVRVQVPLRVQNYNAEIAQLVEHNLGKVVLYQLSYFRIVCMSFLKTGAKVWISTIQTNSLGEKVSKKFVFYGLSGLSEDIHRPDSPVFSKFGGKTRIIEETLRPNPNQQEIEYNGSLDNGTS